MSTRAAMGTAHSPREKHIKGGNCWAGNVKIDVCMKHEQPRGECSECPKCTVCNNSPYQIWLARTATPKPGDKLRLKNQKDPKNNGTWTVQPTKWAVKVKRISKNHYTTCFTVGAQTFTIADAEDDPEARIHCLFIKQMFVRALSALGLAVPGGT